MNAHERYMEINKDLFKGIHASYTLRELVTLDRTDKFKLDILNDLKIDFHEHGYIALETALKGGDKRMVQYLLGRTRLIQGEKFHPVGKKEVNMLIPMICTHSEKIGRALSLIAEVEKETLREWPGLKPLRICDLLDQIIKGEEKTGHIFRYLTPKILDSILADAGLPKIESALERFEKHMATSEQWLQEMYFPSLQHLRKVVEDKKRSSQPILA